MDTKALLADARIRFDIVSQKKHLKEKYQSKLLFVDQGGLWESSLSFISELNGFPNDSLIILDKYENPVKISKNQLLEKAIDVYNAVMTEWHDEYQKLQHNR